LIARALGVVGFLFIQFKAEGIENRSRGYRLGTNEEKLAG
jgi:hypothetical protein